ncbi:MAG TPA: hypothetical protein PKJ41_10405 [Bryobacteraceae bacterium]|nr:hypothetical protein [Bryobacteraceae bacterium]HPT25977.1 hypothetical protein [Bryobacteraceae bacterium]
MSPLILLILVAASWHVVASMMIVHNLRTRGLPVSFLLIRLMLPKYMGQYREITTGETGRCGPLFYHAVVSILVALVAAVAMVILKHG